MSLFIISSEDRMSLVFGKAHLPEIPYSRLQSLIDGTIIGQEKG